MKRQCNKGRWAAIMVTVVLLVCHLRLFAVESVILPLEMESEDLISVDLPTIMEGEKSPLDFVLDPLGLLYETGAAHLGGGVVEEGATILFQNKEGEYNFSRYSDQLAVTNRSAVPILLTITAWVTDIGEVHMVESDDFTDNDECSVYLAVVDDQGNAYPILADGEVTIQVEMRAAPENTYVYNFNENLQSYQPVQSEDFEENNFDTYLLGLVGACNPSADWSNISVRLGVAVRWRIDPIITEEEEIQVDEGYTVQNEDESVSGNDLIFWDGTVSGNDLGLGR